jgi:hypothetical protein
LSPKERKDGGAIQQCKARERDERRRTDILKYKTSWVGVEEDLSLVS